jgi:hypothetical protein
LLKVIITGDAEFDGTEVVTWFKAQPNWDYACRTAKNFEVTVLLAIWLLWGIWPSGRR